ncbi:MAG TPA: hypothetical protein VFO97_01580, partial [Desertimonas sp.]|nr:hypothetical protein [Desertimonas sp.]
MRTRTLAAFAAVSVLVFAACGDDDEGASGDSTIAELAPATEAIEPPGADAATSAPEAAAAATAAAVDTTGPAAAAVETTGAAAAAADTTEAIEPPGA